MRFKRSAGLTQSEKVLSDLCDRSFLKLWTYPNLFKKPGKELTDLLVVFGRDILLFSDKSCAYPNTGNPGLDWSRWYRRSISDSVHQIDQAERWLSSCPDRVFLDAKCTAPLPLDLPSRQDRRIHRICVALGAGERAQASTGRRGLAVFPSVQNDAIPFTVGKTDKAGGWVHIFDDQSLAIILKELSTISDFIHYLDSKMEFFNRGKFVGAESELDLLAYYLWNDRTFPPSELPVQLEPGLWPQVEADPSFQRGRAKNEASYFWDRLIEYVTGHYLEETLEFGNEMEMSDHERLVRIMAGETRFFRRILSNCILERAEIARQNAIGSILESGQPDVNYVLYIGRGDQGGDHVAYRADRASILKTRCIAAKAVKPEKRYIVGIGLDARGAKGSSEDFMLLDTQDWSSEAVEKADQLRRKLGYFIPGNVIESQVQVDEYPDS
ncbi:hypothetical protein [Ancylobacter pratisalsi]|uniref:Uncharacterized protein n=1 Tax=Ancylobacter pratisalsi TaxID=1745854 RepID=A0A6P1YRH0_9HYPH|nr:hypothetical protein [Ancylobacter pratisalsi]QIB34334.1 hypothetical protein G3A50_11895 [Ancylobacter pratisalsi]